MKKSSKKVGVHTIGAPVLRASNRKVLKLTPAIKEAVKNMWTILEKIHGAGLSGPQIGLNKRVLIVNTGRIGEVATLFNPEIIWQSDNYTPNEEGCLSIPGAISKVWRPEKVKIKAMNLKGKIEEIEAGGIFSKALQHEIDHLNGILMIDYSPAEDRRAVLEHFKVAEDNIEYKLLENAPLGLPPEKMAEKTLLYDAAGNVAGDKATLYDARGNKV